MKLPELVVGRKTLWLNFFIGGFSTIILYQISNRVHLFEPQLLEFGPLDYIFDLHPWTIWIYFTEYIIFIVAWFGLKENHSRTMYMYNYMSILLVSVTVFVFFPTTFPRDQFPVSADYAGISGPILEYFRANFDTPANCLPSLHVSTCFVSAFSFWRESKKKFGIFFLWSIAVSISTLTTKQHYFADIWTAFLLVLIFFYYFFYIAEYREVKK